MTGQPENIMIPPIGISNPLATTNLIVIMGVSGSGKSSIAHALASHYGYSYLDADDFHSVEARERMASGLPLTDEMRYPWVARICDHLQAADLKHEHSVLAFSGLRQAHRDMLRAAGLKTVFLFLHSNKDVIQQRIERRTGHFMAPKLLDSQFDALETPALETDVFKMDVSPSLDTLIAQAIDIVDEHLLTEVRLCC